ncbi:hypothetical protein FXO37_08138 [Capsicum annuum]|nr:hypothetical protein FXO37_08138 [Capsicum annuum]
MLIIRSRGHPKDRFDLISDSFEYSHYQFQRLLVIGIKFKYGKFMAGMFSKDVEGVSADIGPATLESLFAAVGNLKPDNTNVETSIMQVDYSSTLFESAQIELDAILKVIAAPVDDVLIEVVPLSESVVNQHDISDSQLSSDFSDAVVAAHQATNISAKRTRTRSKVFKSPYPTEYASGSKAIEDQIVEPKHKFAFDDFLISDNISRGVIEEYKQWVEEGLLKFHSKK